MSPVSKARRFAQACSWAAPSCCRCAPAALLPLPETALSLGILYRLVFLHTDPNLRPFSTRVAALLSACLHPSCSSGGLRGSHLGAAGPAQPSGARAGAGPRPPQAQAGSHPSIQGRSLAGSVDLDLHLPCIPPHSRLGSMCVREVGSAGGSPAPLPEPPLCLLWKKPHGRWQVKLQKPRQFRGPPEPCAFWALGSGDTQAPGVGSPARG